MESNPRGVVGGATQTIQFFRGLSVTAFYWHRLREGEHWLQTESTILFLYLRRPHGAFTILTLSWENVCHYQAAGTTAILS